MAATTTTETDQSEDLYDPWYKRGVMFLYAEMGVALLATAYSFVMSFGGMTVMLGH